MIEDIISGNSREHKFLCTVKSTLSRNGNVINHLTNSIIIEAFDYKNFFYINDLKFDLDTINRYFNNDFHNNYRLYIENLKILEYVPKYINKYTLTASVYIKPQVLNCFILNQHVINTLEGNVVFDDIDYIGEQYSIIEGSNFDELSLLRHFLNRIEYDIYIHQHNYLYDPVSPMYNLNTHLKLLNTNIHSVFEVLLIMERNMAIDKYVSHEGDDLVNHKINELPFYNKPIDITLNDHVIFNNHVIYDKGNDRYILIHNDDQGREFIPDITDSYIRRIIIKKNIFIIQEPIFYYLLSSIKHFKDRFVLINYKDWAKLSFESKIDLIMTCFDDITPVANANKVVDYKPFIGDLSTHICRVLNGNNFMDITKITKMTSYLYTINPSSSFYDVYNQYLNDANNKETDVMMLDFISCGNYFPTFNHISKNKQLKAKIDKKHKKIECCICLESRYMNQMVATECGHLFCKKDIIEIFNEAINNTEHDTRHCTIRCPLCRAKLEDQNIYILSKKDKICNYIKKNILDYKTSQLYRKLNELKGKSPSAPELHIVIGNTKRWLSSITNLLKNMKFNKNIIIKPMIWKSRFDFNDVNNIKNDCFHNIKYSKVEYHVMNSSYRGDYYEQNYYKNLTNIIYFFNNVYSNFMDIIDNYNNITTINDLKTMIDSKQELLRDVILRSGTLNINFNYYVIKNTIDEKIFKKEIQFMNHFKNVSPVVRHNSINNVPIVVYS